MPVAETAWLCYTGPTFIGGVAMRCIRRRYRGFLLLVTLLVQCALLVPACSAQGIITTVAGSTWIFRGDGGPAVNAPLGGVAGVAVDSAGNVFAADSGNCLVVKVSPAGTLKVVAGNGVQGFSGDGGPATAASLGYPSGVAVDAAGNIYVADTSNYRIRKVSPAGVITTVAGNGDYGFSGDGGPATGASLRNPGGVAVDAAGNIYVADTYNHRIRKVGPAAIITTVGGSGATGAIGGGFSGDNGPATAASLYYPEGVAVDAAGNIYVADYGNKRIRKVSPVGIITTVAGNGIEGFSGDGGPATAASLHSPQGVALDAAGNVYVADTSNYRIRKVSPAGIITTVAGNGTRGFSGDGGPATAAPLSAGGVAVDAAGNIYVADGYSNRIRKASSAGTITTVAGNGLYKFSGDGGAATAASLCYPEGVAVDGGGNLYIADAENARVRKVSPAGIITTVAGNGIEGFSGDGGLATAASLGYPYGVAADAAGNIYVVEWLSSVIRKVSPAGIITTVAGNGIPGFSGDGGPATAASLGNPSGVAVDAAGNLYVADTYNHRIRKVSPAGIITTVGGSGATGVIGGGFSGDGGPATAASLWNPGGVAVDAAGNIYVADTGSDRIRKVSPAGIITTVAGNGDWGFSGDGGPATAASLGYPSGVAVDAAGDIYVADVENNRIRKVSPAGIITTVAGNGFDGFSGDGGPATAASLGVPDGVAVDAAGNIYVTVGDRVRKVLAVAPGFSAAPTSLSFSASAGSAVAGSRQVALTSNVAGLAWVASARSSSGASWLSISPASGQIPASITVSVDASNLAAGTYQGSLDVTAPGASPSLVTIAVTFTVSAPLSRNLSVQPASLSFQMLAGGAAPPDQVLRIENAGGGTLSWTAEATGAGGNWLKLGTAAGVTPSSVQISVNPAGLAAGSYSGSITVRSPDSGQSVSIPVSLLVSAPAGVMLLSQTSTAFRAVEGGGVEPPQTFGVLNIGSGSFDWSAQATASWLRLSPAAGTSIAGTTKVPLVNVSVDPTGLAADSYIGFIRVTAASANNSPQLVRVDLRVLARGSQLPAVVRPSSLIFFAVAGGSSPSSQEVGISTTETAPVVFQSQAFDGPWVKRIPDVGSATADMPGRIVVQPELGSLAKGEYRAALAVHTRNDNEVRSVKLLFVVLAAGSAVTPAMRREPDGEFDGGSPCVASKLFLQFASIFSSVNAVAGWPTSVLVNARDDCGNPAVGGQVSLSFSNGDYVPPLTDLKTGQYHGFWRPTNRVNPVTVTATALWRGLEAKLTATAQIDSNPNPKGLLNQGGVLLAAGYQRGPLAPGSIISLFGQKFTTNEGTSYMASALPLPAKLGGVRVLIADKEAPLFYVGYGQVNAQVPADLPADRQLQVMVETDGVASPPEPLQTVSSQPGIFTLDPRFGAQQGAILIANTDRLAMRARPDVPSEPAPRGGYVSIYCTGLGPTDPPVASGQAGPTSEPLARVKTPVSVSISGQSASVVFAGLAPGFAAVYQVNAQVPDGVTPGDAVPVIIAQGAMRSNTVTIAVR